MLNAPDANDVLVIGNWREGLGEFTATFVKEVDKRRETGAYRDLPYESTVAALTDLLDSYDQYNAEVVLAD